MVDKGFCPIIFASQAWYAHKCGGFAPAGATTGLSARPLETFGPHICGNSCKLGNRKFHSFESEHFFQ